MTAWAYTVGGDRAFIATDSAVSANDRYCQATTKLVYAPHLHIVSAVRGNLLLARHWHHGLLATALAPSEVVARTADELREIEAHETENSARLGLAEPTLSCSVLLLHFTAGRAQGVVYHSTVDAYAPQSIPEGYIFAIPSPQAVTDAHTDAHAASSAPPPPAPSTAQDLPWSVRTGTCLQAIRDVRARQPHVVGGEIIACEFTEFAAHFFRVGPCDD